MRINRHFGLDSMPFYQGAEKILSLAGSPKDVRSSCSAMHGFWLQAWS